MKTKYLVKFLNNTAHWDTDLELVHIVQLAIQNNRLNTPDSEYIFDFIDPERHEKLKSRVKTDHSRKLAANHLKTSIRSAFIKSLYENMSMYFQDILKSATAKGLNMDRLMGEHAISIPSKELVRLGTYEKILDRISLSIFRQLENERSTKSLIEKMNRKLGLDIGDDIIEAAIPYLELRHLLVHCQGKADQQFCENYPLLGAEDGKLVKLDNDLINNAKIAITALVKEFDRKIVVNSNVSDDELQP